MTNSIIFQGRTPHNTQFGDTYFSKADGRAETSHVFIGCNNLPKRWMSMQTDDIFTIAELGFGTGLNFLETVRQWCAQRYSGSLKYFSFEAFPMPTQDLHRSLEPWPELSQGANWLTGFWPPASGWHSFTFKNVTLNLYIGDARTGIEELNHMIDAWYLDGFTPARNPELWEEKLLKNVFKYTLKAGSFSTYTSAGWVRRNLQAAGFEVFKIPGHGTKREMLHGFKP